MPLADDEESAAEVAKKKELQGLAALEYAALTVISHKEPDYHLIGDAIAPPSTINAVSTTASALGSSTIPAREDHVHLYSAPSVDPGLFSARMTLVSGVAVTTADVISGVSGGTITTSGGYTIHTFTSSGTFYTNIALTADVLVVAGGGGGKATIGGGGGGGGMKVEANFAIAAGSFSVTVGAGGAGGSSAEANGTQGGNSIFSTITSTGGGLGQTGTGGSGGGGPRTGTTFGAGTVGQGNDGGKGGNEDNTSGGGGGAGAVGANATANVKSGNGGAGLSNSYSGSAVTYAGGGGGGARSAYTGGTGGAGGGGNGGVTGVGANGTANTGGGGGGGGFNGTHWNGGAGGSGIVIIRYLTISPQLYLTPYKGNKVSVYDGSAWVGFSLTEISKAIVATTLSMYDVFLYSNAGVLTLEFLIWTNATTRATALVLQDGVLVKSGATTRRYVGSFYSTATDQITDSITFRCLWNNYNRVPRRCYGLETTVSWTLTGSTWRAVNNSTTSCRINLAIGVIEDAQNMSWATRSYGDSYANYYAQSGIALDSTTAAIHISQARLYTGVAWGYDWFLGGSYTGYIGLGFHYYQQVEWAVSNTFHANSTHTYITGTVMA